MRLFFYTLFVILLSGCADFKNPGENLTVESVVGGGPSLTVGMTQDEVLEKWGKPDEKRNAGETRWGSSIEMWSYRAWFPDVPVNYKYVSKGRNLYFEGNSLVRWEDIDSSRNSDDQKKDEPSTFAGSDSPS